MPDFIKILNSTYFSIGSFIFFQQLGRFIKLDEYAYQLRILYLVAQMSIIGMNYLVIQKIKNKNGKRLQLYTLLSQN